MQVFLSPADAARMLDITPSAVRQMERRGVLPLAARTEGGIRLFHPSDVMRLAEKRKSGLQPQEEQSGEAETETSKEGSDQGV